MPAAPRLLAKPPHHLPPVTALGTLPPSVPAASGEGVGKRPGPTIFEVHKGRWIVERTLGWFGRYRQLSKDYEQNLKSSETWIYSALIHCMSRFQLPDKNRDED
jgi:transposase